MDKTSSNTVTMLGHESITVPADDSEYPKFVEYMKKIGLGKRFKDGNKKPDLCDRTMMMYYALSDGKPLARHMKKLYHDFKDIKDNSDNENDNIIKVDEALRYALGK